MAFWRLSSLLLLAACAAAISHFRLLDQEFQTFKTQHDKQYKDQVEEHYRLNVYRQNKMKIEKHNEVYAKGEVSYALGVNKFTDMTEEEKRRGQGLLGMTSLKKTESNTYSDLGDSDLGDSDLSPSDLSYSDLPKSVDWRTKGAVTEVKDQGKCASSYAFASVGAFESQMFLKTGNLVPYSVQYIVDCAEYAYGCWFGLPSLAYSWTENNKGMVLINDYRPYDATFTQKYCKNVTFDASAKIHGYMAFQKNNETDLMRAVATYGPISASIATPAAFYDYKEGVFECPWMPVHDHGILVVGYGTDPVHGDYWIVKNSWGTAWGEDGYVRIGRNRKNNCVIASLANIPIVSKKGRSE